MILKLQSFLADSWLSRTSEQPFTINKSEFITVDISEIKFSKADVDRRCCTWHLTITILDWNHVLTCGNWFLASVRVVFSTDRASPDRLIFSQLLYNRSKVMGFITLAGSLFLPDCSFVTWFVVCAKQL